MLELSNKLLSVYSLTSIGLIFAVYKIFKRIRTNSLAKSYFQNKTVLITGASGGLGKAIAEELYPLGAQLILCARNNEELNKVKSNLMLKSGKEPEILILDVGSKLDVIRPKLDEVINKFKRVDILINNAGVSFRGESFTAPDEVYEKIMNINYYGAVRLTNYFVNKMIQDNNERSKAEQKRRQYSIVNIGSVQSYLGLPYRSVYCSSKHALLAHADALRGELFHHKNIDVINVQPGYINTNVSINALRSDGAKNNTNDDDHRLGFSPNYVAQVVIRSIINRDQEVIVAILLHRVAIWLRFFFPRTAAWVVQKRAQKLYGKNFND
ncbi:unnamed protein product [Brachionus calyciflorus]|uniref:Uncharacterized protein n=1 Tax=Brachionus calyciflorus TaxID=104777 RepID=A0A813T3A6_9BILA|nr:unnamed protein product [Brachionus calyciflorus]